MFQSVLDRLRERQTAELESVGEAEAGFTLIELMVVLLIIAILLAIAIPTFLGVTSSANDRAAQSNLTNGLTEATAQYQSAGQSFAGISSLLVSSAPEYTWTSGVGALGGCGTGTPNCISVAPYDVSTAGDQQAVVIAAMAKTGTCWYVAQLQAGPGASGLTGTGFDTVAWNATLAPGIEDQGIAPSYNQATATAIVRTAGTYYAKKTPATTAQCNASYPTTTGFVWGPSFSSPGVN
jgi:type IV pilus assembly protein PilA